MDKIALKKELFCESTKKQMTMALGDNQSQANTFMVELWSIINENGSMLANCEPESIVQGAVQVAAMGLTFQKGLGQAALIPYKNGQTTVAQLQIMYKGILQLAMRSGEYAKMGVVEITKEEFVKWNKITEEIELNIPKTGASEIVGYYAFFETNKGFKKADYWPVEKVREHAKKYSKSFNNPQGVWQQNFDAMAKKTVLKALVRTYGILDYHMVNAMRVDQAVVDKEGVKYVDNSDHHSVVNVQAEEVKEVKSVSLEELQ